MNGKRRTVRRKRIKAHDGGAFLNQRVRGVFREKRRVVKKSRRAGLVGLLREKENEIPFPHGTQVRFKGVLAPYVNDDRAPEKNRRVRGHGTQPVGTAFERENRHRFHVDVALGHRFSAMVLVKSASHTYTPDLVKQFEKLPSFERAFEVSGNWDVVLLASTPSPEVFNDFIETVPNTTGVEDTESLIVLKKRER